MQMFGSVSKTLDQSMGRRPVPVKDALWNTVVNIYGKLRIGWTGGGGANSKKVKKSLSRFREF